MSKNLEKEYKQMMEDLSPDLWDRIEAGVNAGERANNVLTFDSVSTERREAERPSKIRNFYQYRALAGVAACFVLLMIAVPTVRNSMLREKQDAEMASIVIDGSNAAADSENAAGTGSFTTEGTVFDEAQPEAAASEEAVSEEAFEEAAEVPAAKSEAGNKAAKNNAAGAETASNSDAAAVEAGNAEAAVEAGDAEAAAFVEAEQSEEVTEAAASAEDIVEETEKSEEKVPAREEGKSGKTSAKDTGKEVTKEIGKDAGNVSVKTYTKPSVTGGKTTFSVNSNRTPVVSKPAAVYDNLNVKIQSTQNDDGTILYTAVVTSKGGALAEGTTIILQIVNPSVGKLAEMKEYTISCKDDGSVSSSGATVYSVTAIAEVIADMGEDANNC